jgi:MerR family mercuric resistance operon transcriptional regulator
MTQLLTIGRLAAEGGVNVETVRDYQRRGLLASPDRPAGGIGVGTRLRR